MKHFAILKFGAVIDLVLFTDEDSWRDAISVYLKASVPVFAFRYRPEIGNWAQVEIVR